MRSRSCVTTTCCFVVALATGVNASDGDRSANLLGKWICSTEQGNSTQETFAQTSDGSLSMVNDVVSPTGASETIDESYRFDASTSMWSATSTATTAFGAYRGTAPAWTDRRWVFEGSEPLFQKDGSMKPTPMRVVYTDLFPAGFRREHQVRYDGRWRDISEEVCTR